KARSSPMATSCARRSSERSEWRTGTRRADARGARTACASITHVYRQRIRNSIVSSYWRPLTGRKRGLKRAPHLLDRDDAAQDAEIVDGHQGTEAAERLGGQHLGQRPIDTHSPATGPAGVERRPHRQPAFAPIVGGLDTLLARDPQKPAALVDDWEPGPAIAQEVLI